MDATSRDYLVISHLTLRNTASSSESGRNIELDGCTGIVLDTLKIHCTARAAIFIEECTSCEVKNCGITTVSYVANQTDGIYSQRNSGCTYHHNSIVISNGHPDEHCDCIQSYEDADMTIHSNFCKQDNTKDVNAQGIFITTHSGTWKVYNNVVHLPYSNNSCISMRYAPADYTPIVVSNTCIGSKWYSIRVEGASAPTIRNNIMWDYKGGSPLLYEGSGANVSNNCMTEDPLLDFEFRITSEDSPAYDAGYTLGPPYNVDKDGVARPLGDAYDCGAYEYDPGLPPPPPPPGNRGVRIVIIQGS